MTWNNLEKFILNEEVVNSRRLSFETKLKIEFLQTCNSSKKFLKKSLNIHWHTILQNFTKAKTFADLFSQWLLC